MNPNSPQNPHSGMATGGNTGDDIDDWPPEEAYILYGAVVAGPDFRDMYYDLRPDWPQTKVRLLSVLFVFLVHQNHFVDLH
jgi:endoglucanase